MVFPHPPAWQLTCPVCATTVPGADRGPCRACGLPAAGHAGLVVARISSTLTELTRDREALLATLRGYARPPQMDTVAAGLVRAPVDALVTPAAAPTTPETAPSAPARTGHHPAPSGQWPAPSGQWPAPSGQWPAPSGQWPPPPPGPPPGQQAPRRGPAAPRRRVSPQQVLLGLGVSLLVAAALAFVAVGWTRFGLVFQAGTMLAATAAAAGTSAWAARRQLRATEEALAVAAGALVAIDLWAVRTLGLFGADGVGLRSWSGISLAVTAVVALGASRVTRSTLAWPLLALLAVQPLPLLLPPAAVLTGPVVAGALLALAVLDLALAGRAGHRVLRVVAQALATVATVLGAVSGVLVSLFGSRTDAWSSTVVLGCGTAGAVLLLRRHVSRGAGAGEHNGARRGAGAGAGAGAGGATVPVFTALAALPSALALAAALIRSGPGGPVAAGYLGVAVLLVAVLGWAAPTVRAVGGTVAVVLGAAGALSLLEQQRSLALAGLALAVGVPAAVAAVRVPVLRAAATALTLLSPVLAALLAADGGLLTPPQAGLICALLAATALTVAGLRTGTSQEAAAVGAGVLAALAGVSSSGSVGATGQIGLQLAVVGAAGVGYWVLCGRRPVLVVAVADLVVALWTVLAGADVQTAEAYTLPAALGLLLLTGPRLRSATSWAGEAQALLVALAPSVLLTMAGGSPVRLVLVVLAATVVVVAGTVTHRQAPFVIGAVALAAVVLAEVAPYAPLVPRWLSLGAAGLVLVVVGASYERRRQQAREAVAWVAQMG